MNNESVSVEKKGIIKSAETIIFDKIIASWLFNILHTFRGRRNLLQCLKGSVNETSPEPD
jgi:hypothetical protein